MHLIVFISDLHLHPEDQKIQDRFDAFLAWARHGVKSIYILGDFFHAWAGDDSIDEWSMAIAKKLHALTNAGLSLFYMPGNRDFLLGKVFARLAGWTILPEPAFLSLGKERVMLVHGDRYCTQDKGHQLFRHLTRNRLFKALFLSFPLGIRKKIVNKVRALSVSKQGKAEIMDVVDQTVLAHLAKQKVHTVIHGHTHKPGLTQYSKDRRYVLSDWDDKPKLLCYDETKGLHFIQI